MSTAVATATPTMAPMFTSEGFLWPSVSSIPAVVTAEVTIEELCMVVLTAGER